MAIKIERVEPGSEAEALGLAPGDELLAVDENELNDSLDYDFYTDSSSFHLKARWPTASGNGMCSARSADPLARLQDLSGRPALLLNHCMFCFIDQLPPACESLYFRMMTSA